MLMVDVFFLPTQWESTGFLQMIYKLRHYTYQRWYDIEIWFHKIIRFIILGATLTYKQHFSEN